MARVTCQEGLEPVVLGVAAGLLAGHDHPLARLGAARGDRDDLSAVVDVGGGDLAVAACRGGGLLLGETGGTDAERGELRADVSGASATSS